MLAERRADQLEFNLDNAAAQAHLSAMLYILKRVASIPLAALVLAYDAADAAFGPLVRPVIAWASSHRLFQRLGAGVAALPPYGVLALLAAPFAVIEPFKIVALVWLAQGRLVLGGVTLVAAHLSSLLICERIFHAGKARLLEIVWFARGYGFVGDVRERAMAWVRATAAWRAAAGFVSRVRTTVGRALSARRAGSRSRRRLLPMSHRPPPRSSGGA